MQRLVTNALRSWKSSSQRMPLIICGARQVGKTWIVKEFGKTDFDKVAYIDFMRDEVARAVFDGSLDPNRLLSAIPALTGVDVVDEGTLVFLTRFRNAPVPLCLSRHSRRCVPISLSLQPAHYWGLS